MKPPKKEPRAETSSPGWSAQLNRLGLGNLASMILRAGRPLAPMLAQILYIADPMIAINNKRNYLELLGAQLEDDQKFSILLRELESELE